MILSLNAQAYLFLATVLIGGVIGLFYDAIRIFRKVIPHKNIFVQVEDGIYWVCVVFFMFLVMLQKNYGEIRFFSIVGAFLGMILYYFILSPLVMAVSDRIIAVLTYLITLFFTIVLTPFRLLYLLFRKPVRKTEHFCHRKGKKLLHLCKQYVKIKKKKAARNRNILFRKK